MGRRCRRILVRGFQERDVGDVRNDFDFLPVTRGIHAVPAVLLGLGVVLRVHRPDAHGEGPVFEVGDAARPLYDAGIVVLDVAARPHAQAHVHGGLWVVPAVERVRGYEFAQHFVVEPPLDAVLGPVDGVVVELFLGLVHGVFFAAVVGRGVAFALDRKLAQNLKS
jgi:hypothetical protein